MKYYKFDGPLVDFIADLHPTIMEKPEFERVAIVFDCARLDETALYPGQLMYQICDALVKFLPEQSEFWLRVYATMNMRWVDGMTALMEET
jgi:hypothetical protein